MTVWVNLFIAVKDAAESSADTKAEQVLVIRTKTLIFALTYSPLPLCLSGFSQTEPLALLTGLRTRDISSPALPHLLKRTMTIR